MLTLDYINISVLLKQRIKLAALEVLTICIVLDIADYIQKAHTISMLLIISCPCCIMCYIKQTILSIKVSFLTKIDLSTRGRLYQRRSA